MTTPRPLPPDLAAALDDYRAAVFHLEELVVDPRDRRALQLRPGRDLEGDPSPGARAEAERREARGLLHRTAEAVALGLPVVAPAPEPDATPRTGGRKAPRARAAGAPLAPAAPDVGQGGSEPRPPLMAPGAVSGDVDPAGPEGAAVRLARWLAGEGRGVRALARDLGVEPSTVSRWAGGRTVPVPKVRARLEELAGIPASTWKE